MAIRPLATIIAGPLQGLSGHLISTKNHRAMVRLTEGQRPILVELDEDMITVAATPRAPEDAARKRKAEPERAAAAKRKRKAG